MGGNSCCLLREQLGEGRSREKAPGPLERGLLYPWCAVDTFPPVTYKNIGEMNLRLRCVGSWVCGFEMKWASPLRDIRHRQGPKDAGSTSVQHGGGNGGPEKELVPGDRQIRAQSGSSHPKCPNSLQSNSGPTSGSPARAAQHRYSRTVSSFRVKPREVGFRSWHSSSLSCSDTKSLPSG